MKNILLLFFSVLLWISHSTQVKGQSTDTVQLKVINVTDSRTNLFTVGSHVTIFDSSLIEKSSVKNLGELLSTSSAIFIKTYGAGASATITSRGTEARHSSILWNGFNINSSSLGLTDFSLVPVSASGKISLLHGGSSPVNGNSAMGSTIILEQKQPTFQQSKSIQTSAEGGSFGNRHVTVGINLASAKIENTVTVFGNSATNEFKYVNHTHRDRPVQKQEHAAFLNYGLLYDFNLKIRENQMLSTAVWYQVNQREIPPMMTVPESFAEQRDSILRTYIGYKISSAKSVLKFNVGYFREHQFYIDPEHNLDLTYFVANYLSDFECRYYASEKLIISSGLSYTYSDASIKEYSRNRNRYQASVYSNVLYQPFRNLKINAGLRQEIASVENPPLAPSLGIELNLFKQIVAVTANAGRHYNLPSMNDLYWIPGGNPDLKPENSWSTEAGLIFFKHKNKLPAISITAFHSVVDNWIKWQPVSGGIYSPDNLRQVKISGIETSLNYKKQIRALHLTGIFNYSYTSSALSQSDDPYSSSVIGKQLMYVPENMFNVIVQLEYHKFSIHFNHSYTGERYTSSDNTQFLDGYHLADISLSKSFILKNNNFNIFFRILNIYDTTYQVLAYRPTPGRWYSVGIKMNFNLNNK